MHILGFLVVVVGAVVGLKLDEDTGELIVTAGLVLIAIYAVMQLAAQRRNGQ